MSILDETVFLERQRFFNGQRLFAPDLQELEAFNREMRWLHNRSLHQPGIGTGLLVTAQKGDRQVTISAGYAIDALGREIVLTHPKVEPIPPVAGDGSGLSVYYDLTLSYPEDDQLEEAETRDGVCHPRGVVRLREEPVFCWVRLRFQDGRFTAENSELSKQIEEGTRLVLARVEIFECKLSQSPSIVQRRSARPPAQPYIACGTTAADVWEAAEDSSGEGNGSIRAVVDTSDAGFITTPCYSARIDRGKDFDVNGKLVLPIILISDAQPDRFTITVFPFEVQTQGGVGVFSAAMLMSGSFSSTEGLTRLAAVPRTRVAARRARATTGNLVKFATENQWRVVWMGVEN